MANSVARAVRREGLDGLPVKGGFLLVRIGFIWVNSMSAREEDDVAERKALCVNSTWQLLVGQRM